MKSNNTTLNTIKNLNAQVEYLNDMKGSLEQFKISFKMEFPNHSFGLEEESLIKEKITQIEKEITEIAGTLEKGVMLSVEEVSQVVLKTCKKRKVKITEVDWDSKNEEDNVEEELGLAQDAFKESCGITFDKNELKLIQYELEADERDDLYLVRVYLAPGMGFAYLDTDRACWGLDVEQNEVFLKSLKNEVKLALD